MGRLTDPIARFFQAYKDGLILSCPPHSEEMDEEELEAGAEDWVEPQLAKEETEESPFRPFS